MKPQEFKEFQEILIHWFSQNKRDLPWRKNKSPYKTWISEIMLQQTQVDTVVPYFERWMRKYPNVEKLAKANIEELVKEWEGLGYYSRVRNIHKSAQTILENHNAEVPCDHKKLLDLKGIGPYTAGAIMSLGFEKPYPIVDGNVFRVYSRLFADANDIASPKGQKHFWKLADKLVLKENPAEFNEALMEFGATVCTPATPKCETCPLQKFCKAYQKKEVLNFPVKKKKINYEKITRVALLFNAGNKFLIEKGIKGKVMADLWEFPYIELKDGEVLHQKIQKKLEKNFLKTSVSSEIEILGKVNHSFTKYRVTLWGCVVHLEDKNSVIPKDGLEFNWVEEKDLENYPFSSGMKRLLKLLKESHQKNLF